MGTYFNIFDSTPASLAADLRTQILQSTDWSQPNAGALPNLMKATTAAGAQMCVQLDDAAVTSKQMQLGVYRTHDGTTGVDKITRYLIWRYSTTGTTNDPIHCVVSAGKEHLFFSIEGPRTGESSPESASYGSFRQSFFIGSIAPYFSGDSVASVVNVALESASPYNSSCYVSRNQADTASWVVARLASIQSPIASSGTLASQINALQLNASDGSIYLWPYVVVEDVAGLRGRISALHFAGFNFDGASAVNDPCPSEHRKISYAGTTYSLQATSKGGGSYNSFQAFGAVSNLSSGILSPIVAVPYSTP